MDNLVFYCKESTSRFQRTFIGSSNYPPIFHRWASPYRIQQRWAYCLSVPGRTDHLTWAFLEALFSAIGPLGLLPKSLLSTSKEFMVIPRKAPAKGPYFQESMAQKWLTSAYPLNSLKVFILFSRDSHSFSRTFILLLSAAQWLQVSQSLPRTCDVLWKPAAVQDLGQSEVTVAPGVQNFRDTPSSILHGSCMTLRVSLSLNVMSQTPHFWERAHSLAVQEHGRPLHDPEHEGLLQTAAQVLQLSHSGPSSASSIEDNLRKHCPDYFSWTLYLHQCFRGL